MLSNPNKILVSACLLGERVRYDAKIIDNHYDILNQWIADDRVVSVCPEVSGGLPIPRLAAEISHVDQRIATCDGDDVTDEFAAGAQTALALCVEHNIKIAVLKERSPSCGSNFIYDGSFTGKVIAGAGVTAALLRSNGIMVFSEEQLELAKEADILAE